MKNLSNIYTSRVFLIIKVVVFYWIGFKLSYDNTTECHLQRLCLLVKFNASTNTKISKEM